MTALKEGAFDEAVSGVDAIAHTASPFYMNAVEPQGKQTLIPNTAAADAS